MAAFTKKELRQFDRLTLAQSSINQMERIGARLRLRQFVEKHGQEKCDAMFAEIKRLGKLSTGLED